MDFQQPCIKRTNLFYEMIAQGLTMVEKHDGAWLRSKESSEANIMKQQKIESNKWLDYMIGCGEKLVNPFATSVSL